MDPLGRIRIAPPVAIDLILDNTIRDSAKYDEYKRAVPAIVEGL